MRDHEQHVLLGPEPGDERRHDGEHEPERIAQRVEDEDVGRAELADQPRRLPDEEAPGLHRRTWRTCSAMWHPSWRETGR